MWISLAPDDEPFIPNPRLVDVITLDYFDVDTDPTGLFQSGHPYRFSDYSVFWTLRNFRHGLRLPGASDVLAVNLRN